MKLLSSFGLLIGLSAVLGAAAGCSPADNGGIIGPGNGTSGAGNGRINTGGVNARGGGSSTDPTLTDACNGPNPPKSCGKQAPPGCGDGKINQDSEKCDDGNPTAGDGCNGACKVEPNYECPTPGQPCKVTFRCGDGIINPGEVCDQGKDQGSPGCSADCKKQEEGYKCVPGEKCVALFQCGNGRIESGETCDPPAVGKGCSDKCLTEDGWRCKPGSCSKLPYCGDGIVQTDLGEKCDQGKDQGSPGCSKDCLTMDATCTCKPGQACVCQKPSCGDGIVQVGEQCDDKGSQFPGCSDTCQLEKGYKCPFAGAPCVPVCGDGILIAPAEQCDPGSKLKDVDKACFSDETADETHPACSVKPGWICDDSGCRQTQCGDGKIEGTEGCDPTEKNSDLGDGCTPTCMLEPSCPKTGGGCSTKCGDGLVLGGEECDDANAVSGDGCSAECKVEAGFTCSQPALGDSMEVPMVVRDFKGTGDFEKGGDFAKDLNYANQGLLENLLDANGLKPVLKSTTGTYNGTPGKDSGIASKESFAQFYSDTAKGTNSYVGTLATTMSLFLNADKTAYVNRFGVNGDGTTNAQYMRTTTQTCGSVGQEDHDAEGNPMPCTVCYYNSNPDKNTPCTQHDTTPCQTDKTFMQCVKSADGKQWNGIFKQAAFDGNPLFFPADALKPFDPATGAQISGNYDTSWPFEGGSETTAPKHNFSFTTEVRFWFKYDTSKNFKLTFVGDDDVWVFVNKHLAVDLGGIHTAVQGVLTLGAGTPSVTVTNTLPTDKITNVKSTPDLGSLKNGEVYEIVVFQVERQTKASSYQLTLSGFNAAHSICKPVCGGAKPGVSPGEACDNGDAGNCNPDKGDCYNKCTTQCTLGPRCGDAVVQPEHEQCDNGTNTDGWAAVGSNACTPDCTLPPSCGDGRVQLDFSEECDNGGDNNDSAYGGCTTQCKLGPYCGDGKKNGTDDHPEACDDGVNDGTYGTCGKDCVEPPRCGDGEVQKDWGEQCDVGQQSSDGCTADCRYPGYCGDGKTDPGEDCDYGTGDSSDKNSGSYGGCNSNCTLAPFCGDGLKNGPEECDAGKDQNTGEYGGCASTCKLGPHCGDGNIDGDVGKEECDDGSGASGNGSANSSCTTACKNWAILL